MGQSYQEKTNLLYKFQLQEKEGRRHKIKALGIEMITEIKDPVDLSSVRDLFPDAPDEVFNRPRGEVDVLLGCNYRHLQPTGGQDRGNLKMVTS